MRPIHPKLLRWWQFTEQVGKKYAARLGHNHPPDFVCRSCADLQSALQRALFQWTKPLPHADHVIDAAEQLMRNEHE